jgi:hypothetical protein
MFLEKLDLDVVFFETAMYLQKFPHMILECIPMPRETGDLAPIYFKVRDKVQCIFRAGCLYCNAAIIMINRYNSTEVQYNQKLIRFVFLNILIH